MALSLDFEGNADKSHKAANECKDIYKASFLSSFLRQKGYYFNLSQSHGKSSFFQINIWDIDIFNVLQMLSE